MRRALRVGLALAAALPLFAACNRSNSVRAGEARLEPHGFVELMKPGHSYERVTKPITIRNGDRVFVRSGAADLRVPDAELALREGSEVIVQNEPQLLRGDLLVVPSSRLSVRSDRSVYEVSGAARLSRGFADTAASYVGSTTVRSAGSSLAVPQYRQATVAAIGQVPRRPEPLKYRVDDAWDRRFLADAIDLGIELQSRSDGASAQFRGQGTTPGFYRTLLPQLDAVEPFQASLLDPGRPPGEHIVGAGLALAGRRGEFLDRWQRIFTFRSEGATWGLVAMDEGVQRVPGLVRSIDEALGRARLPGQPGFVALGPSTPASPGGTTTTTSSGPGSTPPTTSRPPTTAPPTTQPPPIVTVPTPVTGLPIDPAAEQVVDTINGLLPKL
jgi:hypothetical protein